MCEIGLCPECKAPEIFTTELLWLNNGDIIQRANPSGRLAFVECENIDPLFRIIGEIIGMPIEHMIISITSRAIEAFVSRLIPKETKDRKSVV